MRLNRRFVVVLGASLLWAFIVATVFYRVAASGARRAPEPRKALVVASQELPLGTVIHADLVKTVQVPEGLFPKGGYSRTEDVLERPVVSPIQAEEPVVDARIAAKGSGVGLGPLIPPGMRALSVRVNDVAGVAGFVLPGMRVDVLVTLRVQGRQDSVTNTVLQNLLVLSAGQAIQPDSRGQPISATVVTLLVAPAQAEALTLSTDEGHIQLVLRNSNDQQVARTPGQRLHQLYGPEPAAPPAPAGEPEARPRRIAPPVVRPTPVPMPAQRADEVVMIRGNTKTIEPAPPRMAN